VFLAHGLQDGGHQWQEEGVWEALTRAPKRMVLGQWGHGFPVDANLAASGLGDTWSEVGLSWFDFWLKGVGEPPRLGTVDYEDNAGAWHTSGAWPPAEANVEALHLVGGELQSRPGDDDARFVSTPAGGDLSSPPNCPPSIDTPPGVQFMSAPLPGSAVLSGTPVVRLELSSDQPGGVFDVARFVAPDGDPCTDRWLYGGNPDVRWLSTGSVDLRFNAGNLTGRDFPAGRHVVRVDLASLSARVAPGERLGVWMGRSALASGQTSRYSTATITVHPGSQIRLPLVEGTVAGSEPTGDVPPRPFQPEP
jgi:predicted acyl esterase